MWVEDNPFEGKEKRRGGQVLKGVRKWERSKENVNVRKCESSGKYEKVQENVKWVRNSALGFLLGAIAGICYTTQTHSLSLSLCGDSEDQMLLASCYVRD